MRRLLPVLAIVAGCVTVSKSVLMDRSAQPVPKESVYVFLANDSIPSSCQRVALMHASGGENWTNEGQMVDKLRSEAGKLGANAVHLRSMKDPDTGERVVAAILGTEPDRDADAIALWCPDR